MLVMVRISEWIKYDKVSLILFILWIVFFILILQIFGSTRNVLIFTIFSNMMLFFVGLASRFGVIASINPFLERGLLGLILVPVAVIIANSTLSNITLFLVEIALVLIPGYLYDVYGQGKARVSSYIEGRRL